MRRLLVLLLLVLPFPALDAQSCLPNTLSDVSYTGTGCSGGSSSGPKGFCDTSQDVTFTATAHQPAQSCDQYTWTFDDGTPDVTGSSPVITHRYAHAGSYHASVSLASGGGQTSRYFFLNAGLGQFSMLPATFQEGSLAQIVVGRTSAAGAALVDPAYAGPPFKPCVPISGTRLNDDLLGVACDG